MAEKRKIAKNTIVDAVPKDLTTAPGVRYHTGSAVYQINSNFFRDTFYLWECLPDGKFRFIASADSPLELYRIAEKEAGNG